MSNKDHLAVAETKSVQSHTPHPWRWTQEYRGSDGQPAWSLVGTDGYGILSCDAANAPQDLGTKGAADAALLEAAPELLEALRAVVIWADDNGRNFKFVADSDSGVVKRIHAAIAKATGAAS